MKKALSMILTLALLLIVIAAFIPVRWLSLTALLPRGTFLKKQGMPSLKGALQSAGRHR